MLLVCGMNNKTMKALIYGAVWIPLILVGGIRSIQVAEKLLSEGVADYISMSRPFVREPALVKRWASGDLRRATCLSDSLCFRPVVAGEGIYCVTERKQQAALNPTKQGYRPEGR